MLKLVNKEGASYIITEISSDVHQIDKHTPDGNCVMSMMAPSDFKDKTLERLDKEGWVIETK